MVTGGNIPPFLDFGIALERARRRAGLSAAELAQRANVKERTLRRYRSGERKPDEITIRSLEDACGLSRGELLAPPPSTADLQPAVSERVTKRGRVAVLVALSCVVLVVGIAYALMSHDGNDANPVERTLARARDLPATARERTGGTAHTWSDYRTAGGRQGHPIRTEATVTVVCRVRGFVVDSGNRWWYLIASRPWRRRFFATADAFYNQTPTKGLDFRKTRKVDPSVPRCP